MSDYLDPALGPVDAAELCDEIYCGREEALAVARKLRTAGWIVPLLDTADPARPDGVRVVGTVFHPETYQSIGDITYTDPR